MITLRINLSIFHQYTIILHGKSRKYDSLKEGLSQDFLTDLIDFIIGWYARAKNMAAILSIHEKYMKEAIKQAKTALALGEVPIGCVIVHEGKIIGRGYNRRNTDKNTLAHAEITAIRKASKYIGDWRLEECTIYITLEPCQMCAGAIIQARIPEVVMGCMNPKAGCGGSILNILEMPQFNHQALVTRGVMEAECSGLLKTFFTQLREKNKLEKQKRRQP